MSPLWLVALGKDLGKGGLDPGPKGIHTKVAHSFSEDFRDCSGPMSSQVRRGGQKEHHVHKQENKDICVKS